MTRRRPEPRGPSRRQPVWLLALALAALPAGADAQESALEAADAACLTCHGPDGPASPLEVESHRATVHGSALPCVTCHETRHKGVPENPLLAVSARSETCEQCHAAVHPSHLQDAMGGPMCTQCHSVHEDPPISEAGPQMSERCGSCHARALTDFAAGGHAAALTGADTSGDLPTCVTCHPNHVAPEESLGDPRLAATAKCIECHSQDLLISKYGLPAQVGDSYSSDFHGATLQFLWRHPSGRAQPDVMVCSDCHGSHAVGWLASEQVAQVCIGCHEDADAKFAGAWLGHQPVGPRNAVAVWAARIFYYFLIPLSLGGLMVNILFHLRDQRRAGARVLKTEGVRKLLEVGNGRKPADPETVTRFNRLERTEHVIAIITFTLLILTGIPQTVPESDLANRLVELFGGIGWTRIIHRGAGLVFVAALVLHVGRGVINAIRHRRLPSIALGKQDFLDTWETLRHYVRGSPRPKAGKFDFREKFEYWGLLLGGTLMTVTGFVLMFPEVVAWILPGSAVAAARVIHGLEATFAVLVIVVWHSYAVILRPEVFPLDTTMFTGKMSVERLREEHELEYERLFPDRVETPDADAAGPEERPEPEPREPVGV